MDNNGKVQVLEERVENLTQQVAKHETQIARLTDQVSGLDRAVTETKVYLSQIFNSLDDIKNNLRILQDKSDRNNNDSSNRWFDFLKQLLFLVVGAAVTYFFSTK